MKIDAARGRRFSEPSSARVAKRRSARGFTILDVLVSLSIVAVLIALLAPSLARVRETTYRVVCSSNARQLGIGVMMYADANNDAIPSSIYTSVSASLASAKPQAMMTLRLNNLPARWDGLGLLYDGGFIDSPATFYCPSHPGTHPWPDAAATWQTASGLIVGNYHYRGADDAFNNRTYRMHPAAALVSDGLATQSDYNHRIGGNVLTIDLSVAWLPDTNARIYSGLASSMLDAGVDGKVRTAWGVLDDRVFGSRN